MTSHHLGKVQREFLNGVVYRNLGLSRRAVIVGPGQGLDNAVISIDDERVIVITSDPLSIVPSLGMKDSAWLAVHLIASDLATSGVPAQFAELIFNLPPSIEQAGVQSYMEEVSDECRRLRISVVGGHTGNYPGCDFPIVGGGVLFALGDKDRYVTPAMATPGDVVMVTKGAAIETTGVLARTFPNRVREQFGDRLLARAKSYLHSASVVDDARIVASLGLRDAITSMHDATEGGVLGGLYELSSACGRRIEVDKESINVSNESSAICTLFGLDPLTSLSEGSLIFTCKSDMVEVVQRKLRRNNISSFVIGEVKQAGRGLWLRSKGTSSRPVEFDPPRTELYWDAYGRALKSGWN